MARINNSRKALFQTPGSVSTDEHSIVLANSLLSKLDIAEKALANVHAENEHNIAVKEAHKERMDKLRLLLNEIEEDNWKYESVSKLIGI
ncbi:unnamed protein product [Brachionus calyciflorus]|uniref:Uncharacterized protein n=1 Tax=Brachionus calyciflorus TaxID=104777 RepID=A0A813R789_9BILA|nr:unnamed protein product [Brachionus calyciflorus]